MKKQIAYLILVFFTGCQVYGQIYEPVKWKTSVEKTAENEYQLISTATIEAGWHLYSQEVPVDGPIPTTFTYENEEAAFELSGTTAEEEGHTVDDPVFNMRIKFFENKAVFRQKVIVKDGLEAIQGFVEFMVCDDSKCLPPTEVDLVFNLNKTDTENGSIDAPNKANSSNLDNSVLNRL